MNNTLHCNIYRKNKRLHNVSLFLPNTFMFHLSFPPITDRTALHVRFEMSCIWKLQETSITIEHSDFGAQTDTDWNVSKSLSTPPNTSLYLLLACMLFPKWERVRRIRRYVTMLMLPLRCLINTPACLHQTPANKLIPHWLYVQQGCELQESGYL